MAANITASIGYAAVSRADAARFHTVRMQRTSICLQMFSSLLAVRGKRRLFLYGCHFVAINNKNIKLSKKLP